MAQSTVKPLAIVPETEWPEDEEFHRSEAAFVQEQLREGVERVKADRARLRALGIIDEKGSLIGDLPDDMKDGSKTDLDTL